MRYFLLMLFEFILLGNISLNCQDYNIRKIERIIENTSEDKESSELFSIIDYYHHYRIGLLKTNAKELSILPTINFYTALRIISFLDKNPNSNYDEIASALNLSDEQQYILEICTVLDFSNKSSIEYSDFISIRSRTDLPMQKTTGLEKGKYLGTNFGYTNKFNFSISNYRFGFSTDKDIAEDKIIDFYNFYAEKSFDNFKINIGNYKLNSGLGNILSSSFNQPKINTLLSTDNSINNSVSADNSTSTYKSFRGIALSGDILKSTNCILSISAWYSNNSKSATINDSGDVSSIYTSEYYRTQTEIDKKNSLTESVFGAMSLLEFKSISLGTTILNINYDKNIESASSSTIVGNSTLLSSIFAAYTYDSLKLSSEISFSNKAEKAVTLFAKYYSLSSELNLNFRYFSAGFRAPFGNNPGENSSAANEIGLNFGYLYKASKKIRIAFMVDYFETLERTYTVYQPVKGLETEYRMDYKINHNNKLFFKLRYQNKDNQKADENSVKTIFKEEIYTVRLDYEKKWSPLFNQTFRTDFNLMPMNKINSERLGFLLSVSNEYSPFEYLRFDLDLAYYNSDDYYSGIWLFNYFAPGASQISPLYNEGYRISFITKIQVQNKLNLYIGYRLNHKLNVNTIGSGYDLINSNSEQRIQLQAEWMLDL